MRPASSSASSRSLARPARAGRPGRARAPRPPATRRAVKISSAARAAPDPARQQLGAAAARDDADGDLGQPDARRVASATIRSQESASSKPPPSAKPCTAAIVGIGRSRTPVYAARVCGRWRLRSASVKELRSLRSAPTQNARSWRGAEHDGASRCGPRPAPAQACADQRAMPVETAFIAFGRSSTSSATWPCRRATSGPPYRSSPTSRPLRLTS